MKRRLDVVIMLLSIWWMIVTVDSFGWFLVASCSFLVGFLLFVADHPPKHPRSGP